MNLFCRKICIKILENVSLLVLVKFDQLIDKYDMRLWYVWCCCCFGHCFACIMGVFHKHKSVFFLLSSPFPYRRHFLSFVAFLLSAAHISLRKPPCCSMPHKWLCAFLFTPFCALCCWPLLSFFAFVRWLLIHAAQFITFGCLTH